MTDIKDEDLRARFTALREEDSRLEPEFRSIVNRAARSSLTDRSNLRSNLRWVAAAAAILIAAVLLFGNTRDLRREQETAVAAQSITTWQSPTAALLQPPTREFLAPPPLLSSVFDGVTPTLQLKRD